MAQASSQDLAAVFMPCTVAICFFILFSGWLTS
jgi:hypothetical protein